MVTRSGPRAWRALCTKERLPGRRVIRPCRTQPAGRSLERPQHCQSHWGRFLHPQRALLINKGVEFLDYRGEVIPEGILSCSPEPLVAKKVPPAGG
jgi:hypothetical protein